MTPRSVPQTRRPIDPTMTKPPRKVTMTVVAGPPGSPATMRVVMDDPARYGLGVR